MTATEAVDKIFEEERHLFGEAQVHEDPGKSAFAQRLAQIALENRLCMSHLALVNLVYLICTFLAPS